MYVFDFYANFPDLVHKQNEYSYSQKNLIDYVFIPVITTYSWFY